MSEQVQNVTIASIFVAGFVAIAWLCYLNAEHDRDIAQKCIDSGALLRLGECRVPR